MLPPECWETAEVGVGGDHCTTVLDRDGRVLGVGNQLSGCTGLAAQSFEYVHMIGAGTYDSRLWPLEERIYECERAVESGRRIEYSRVGHDADESGDNKHGESEWFGPRRKASDPGRILRVLGHRVLNVCIDQDVYVG